MSEKEAVVTVKKIKKVTEAVEADHKFIIAFCLIIGYAIALLIPIVLDKVIVINRIEVLSTVRTGIGKW